MRIAVPSDGGVDGNSVPMAEARDIVVADVGPDGVKEIRVLKMQGDPIGELKRERVELLIAPEIPEALIEGLGRAGIRTIAGVGGRVMDVLRLALAGVFRTSSGLIDRGMGFMGGR